MMGLRRYKGTRGRMKTRVARSGYEARVMEDLDVRSIGYSYEGQKIPYSSEHHYFPDLTLDNGVIVEIKGYFPGPDRRKMKLVKEQHPHLDIRLLFQRNGLLYKGSKTTYTMWAEKQGFICAIGEEIPDEWTKTSVGSRRAAAGATGVPGSDNSGRVPKRSRARARSK